MISNFDYSKAYEILEGLKLGYYYFFPIVFICFIIWRNAFFTNLLSISNQVFFIVIICSIITFFLLPSYLGASPYEIVRFFWNSSVLYAIGICIGYVMPFFFIFKKYRTNIDFLTLFLIVLWGMPILLIILKCIELYSYPNESSIRLSLEIAFLKKIVYLL